MENPRTIEVLQVYNQYYAKTGAFPTDKHLDFIPEVQIPSFVKTEKTTSPRDLYDEFRGTEAYDLVGVQFLAALHVLMDGESYLSRNAMSELFHNLSMQASSIEDDSIPIQFIHLTALCHSIGNLLRNKNHLLEEEMVENKLSKKKLRYPRDSDYMSFPKTPEEILEQRKKKRELARRVLSVMSPYEKQQFSDVTDVVKKEMKDAIEEVKTEVTTAEIDSIFLKKE